MIAGTLLMFAVMLAGVTASYALGRRHESDIQHAKARRFYRALSRPASSSPEVAERDRQVLAAYQREVWGDLA